MFAVRLGSICPFCRREDGSMTSLGLFVLIAGIMIGGLGMDVAFAVMNRTHLQIAADSAAHAALIARDTRTEEEAKEVALRIAQATLPTSRYGDTIRADDIHFGTYDPETDEFVPVPGSRDAVLVTSKRLAERGNALGMFFLRFVGLEAMDVRTRSVFTTYRPGCFEEGFVAGEEIVIRSNNIFRNGFCLHSNGTISVRQNNYFEDGVLVTLPDLADLDTPGGRLDGNPGLEEAARSGAYHLRILSRIDDIVEGFDDPMSDYFREDYFATLPATIPLDPSEPLDETVWQSGMIHAVSCGEGDFFDGLASLQPVLSLNSGNGVGNGSGARKGNGNGGEGSSSTLRIPANTTLEKGAIVTDCAISLGSRVALEDVIVISTNTSDAAITAAANVRFGRDDDCVPEGGVQVVTEGGMRFAAGLSIYGSQLIAATDIVFTANANGLEGASLIAGRTISGTANMEMGFCGGQGMGNVFASDYFRLSR